MKWNPDDIVLVAEVRDTTWQGMPCRMVKLTEQSATLLGLPIDPRTDLYEEEE